MKTINREYENKTIKPSSESTCQQNESFSESEKKLGEQSSECLYTVRIIHEQTKLDSIMETKPVLQ